MKRLPTGIQDFVHLRERDCVYVDKTETVFNLVQENTAIFLSRPRRFGKSLLVSVLKELFEGNEDLFRGLWIHSRWDWTKRHPVVRLSLGAGHFQLRGVVDRVLESEVRSEALRWDVPLPQGLAPWELCRELLRELSRRGPRPVVLIDEYDKPILQNLESIFNSRSHLAPEVPCRSRDAVEVETEGGASLLSTSSDIESLQAREEELSILEDNRQRLRAFYSCLKDAGTEFLFLTGVSRLAKASVFSELNQLRDVTWIQEYSGICGITQKELERDFPEHLSAMALQRGMPLGDLLERIRRDYNGFRFAPETSSLYNPFSTCQCLVSREFGSYWTETGTPEFLVRLMRGSNVELADVEGVWLPTSALATLEPDQPEVLPLLLQTGYLTIQDWRDGEFRLGFPNHEVRTAFVEHLLKSIHGKTIREVAPRARAMATALLQGDVERFLSEMKRVYSGIAYQLDDAHEKRYHGLFQAMCNLSLNPPAVVLAEVPNALGRSDLVVDLPDTCWIFEFKRDTDPVGALEQIASKEYDTQWEGRLRPDGTPKPVRSVAVTFGTAQRNIIDWC